MTPSYASPEQVRGEPVTTASDVYSLGVLLYELLTGRGPYGAAKHLKYTIEHAILEEEPERPSAALLRSEEPSPEEIAHARKTRPSTLERGLQGDLDNILLMALRKEPWRRYGSATQLSRDIEATCGASRWSPGRTLWPTAAGSSCAATGPEPWRWRPWSS